MTTVRFIYEIIRKIILLGLLVGLIILIRYEWGCYKTKGIEKPDLNKYPVNQSVHDKFIC